MFIHIHQIHICRFVYVVLCYTRLHCMLYHACLSGEEILQKRPSQGYIPSQGDLHKRPTSHMHILHFTVILYALIRRGSPSEETLAPIPRVYFSTKT